MHSTTQDVAEKALQIKGSMFTATVLQLQTTDLNAITRHLNELAVQAPQFFQQAPSVLDVSAIQHILDGFDFAQLLQQLKSAGLLPVGMVGASPSQAALAHQAGLPSMPQSKHYKSTTPAPEPLPVKAPQTMVIDGAVRSGQRIYAKGTDLIVLGTVSHGAEVLADGHIHIYGALHGRALAGASGDTQTRIFCHRLDAELVAIAGLYQLSEGLGEQQHTGPVCVSYQQNALIVTPLTNTMN